MGNSPAGDSNWRGAKALNYRHLRQLLGGEDARKDEERFFGQVRKIVADTVEEKIQDLKKLISSAAEAGKTTGQLNTAGSGSKLEVEEKVSQPEGRGVASPPLPNLPAASPTPRLVQTSAEAASSPRRAPGTLDYSVDSVRLVRAYANALQVRQLSSLVSDLKLPPDAAQERRRVEIWIPAVCEGRMGFIVIPNPERHDEELGRQLQKLYGLTRMEKVPIVVWKLLTPAWVDKNRAEAHNSVPMALDPSGDYLAGCLERSDVRLEQ